MKVKVLITLCMLGAIGLTGCSQTTNPTAPVAPDSEPTKSTQIFRPNSVIYQASLAGHANVKPWNWLDALDYPSYNATIVTSSTTSSSKIKLTPGSSWGKVSTHTIDVSSTTVGDAAVRIFVPKVYVLTSWKVLIQEVGGSWRQWVLQDSSTDEGYKDYDFNTTLAEVKAGTGKFCFQVVVEGYDTLSYIELGELYFYDKQSGSNPGLVYWYDEFGNLPPGASHVTSIDWKHSNLAMVYLLENSIGRFWGNTQLGGHVTSPTLFWDAVGCNTLDIIFSTDQPRTVPYTVWIYEVGGQERQWQLTKDPVKNGWIDAFDLDVLDTQLADGAQFNIVVDDLYGELFISLMAIN